MDGLVTAPPTEEALVASVTRALGKAVVRVGPGHGYDIRAGDVVAKTRLTIPGVGGLRSALLELAMAASNDREITRAWLVVGYMAKVSYARADEEWKRFLGVLRSPLVGRVGIVAFARDHDLVRPEENAMGRHIAEEVRSIFDSLVDTSTPPRGTIRAPSPKFFAVWSVLLDAWLRREGALRIGDVGARARCSHPTVLAALARMEERGEIQRRSSRSVALRGFPTASFQDALVMADSARNPVSFADATGRGPDPEGLLRRLTRARPAGIVLGGVAAARRYDRNFDLVGLPRLEVTSSRGDWTWLAALDPALEVTHRNDPARVLIVREPLAAVGPAKSPGALLLSGPTETLLDLYDLRLVAQADALVATLRDGRG